MNISAFQNIICRIDDRGDLYVKCCDKCGAVMEDKRIRNERFAKCSDCGFTEPL